MENWKQDIINEIQISSELNAKQKERMINLINKSQHMDYKTFQWDPDILKKMYHIHVNYRHYDRDQQYNLKKSIKK